MLAAVAYSRAWLWLLVACSVHGAEIGLPLDDVGVTTIIPGTTAFAQDAGVNELGEVSAGRATSSNASSLTSLSSTAAETVRQEISNDGNVTLIRVICPSLPLPVPPDPDSLSHTSDSNGSDTSSPIPSNALNSSFGTKEYSSSHSLVPSIVAKVDIGALEFDRNVEVAMESERCQKVAVDGGVPSWVEQLTLTAKEGNVILRRGWAEGADNLKMLWLRISEGLIVDDGVQFGEEMDVNLHDGDRSGIERLCNVLPPSLELLDVSHTPLKVLHLEGHCSSRLLRLEASHSDLTRVSLCTPGLLALHLTSNSIVGNLDWVTCEDGLAAVENLQVNRNSLTEVSTCRWAGLRTLDLRRNSITSMDLSSCPSPHLTRLTASHNELVTPPVLPPALQHLELKYNRLQSLPMITPALQTLDVSHNNIIEVGKSRFKRARKLMHLNLANNHITHIKEHDLTGLRELITLDVSHNRLREIAGASLMSLRRLQSLRLHHNHLTTLDSRDLSSLLRRTHATLHHNPWMCVCNLLSSLQQLQHCPDCQHQTVAIECRERNSWVAASSVLKSCMQAVQEVTQRLNDESDEDLSEEDGDDEKNGNKDSKAVMAVPGLLILILIGAVVAMSYRLYHRHKRAIHARLNPLRNRCRFCSLCGCSPVAMNNNDLNHHQHGQLSQNENDSDTETEL